VQGRRIARVVQANAIRVDGASTRGVAARATRPPPIRWSPITRPSSARSPFKRGMDARFAKELSFPPFPRYRTIGRRRPLLGSLMAR